MSGVVGLDIVDIALEGVIGSNRALRQLYAISKKRESILNWARHHSLAFEEIAAEVLNGSNADAAPPYLSNATYNERKEMCSEYRASRDKLQKILGPEKASNGKERNRILIHAKIMLKADIVTEIIKNMRECKETLEKFVASDRIKCIEKQQRYLFKYVYSIATRPGTTDLNSLPFALGKIKEFNPDIVDLDVANDYGKPRQSRQGAAPRTPSLRQPILSDKYTRGNSKDIDEQVEHHGGAYPTQAILKCVHKQVSPVSFLFHISD